jgi:hypothetical protein
MTATPETRPVADSARVRGHHALMRPDLPPGAGTFEAREAYAAHAALSHRLADTVTGLPARLFRSRG